MQQIADWLEKLGMSEYAERFAENDIDSALREFTQATTASTTLTAEAVGTTRVRWKPPLLRRWSYSARVRS